MRMFFALVSGALFGAGLMVSGMTDTKKVQGFLDLFGSWEPTLMFVMGGALIPMAIAWRLTSGRKPIVGGEFPAQPATQPDRQLVVGAALFGIGWGLAGLCPGPALASISFGGASGLVFFGAMILGMWGAVPIRRRLDSAPVVS